MTTTPATSNEPLKAILLVDDDRQLAESLRDSLISENFLVDLAHDGAEAAVKVKAHYYDAIVCDMLMPKLRGDEFYRVAVEHNPTLESRFLFITGFVDNPEVRQFLTSISARYLLKPFSLTELSDAVRKLVN